MQDPRFPIFSHWFRRQMYRWKKITKGTYQKLAVQSGIEACCISHYMAGRRIPDDYHAKMLGNAMHKVLDEPVEFIAVKASEERARIEIERRRKENDQLVIDLNQQPQVGNRVLALCGAKVVIVEFVEGATAGEIVPECAAQRQCNRTECDLIKVIGVVTGGPSEPRVIVETTR